MFLLITLAGIGAIVASMFIIDSLWSLFEFITSYLMKYFIPNEVLPLSKKFGNWAAVTGSTDGIGRQYAMELARRGINVVLISRSRERLRGVADEIERTHSVKTKIIVADFSKGTEVYPHIEMELKDIPVGILVNNVGINYEYPTTLCDLPTSKIWELINVNVVPVTTMTRMVLPGMVGRGRGAIVNVSSGSELQPLPLMAIYGATKVYVRNFTMAIREEYSGKGIYIQHLSPLYVTTKINSFSQRVLKGSMLIPDAQSFTKSAVATLGRVHNTTGYWTHGIQYFFIKLAPEWIRIKIGAHMNRSFRDEYMSNLKTKAQ